MKKSFWMILFAVAMILSFVSVTSADENGIFSAENFSGTIIFTSDYVSDGVSMSDQDPAVQGSIDYSHPGTGIFLGLWGSSWDDGGYSNSVELGVWAGQAGSLGPLDYDLTLYYWFYPGAKDDGFEFDYFQAGINLSHTFENVVLEPTLTIGYLWSPEYFGEEGVYHKFIGKLSLPLVYGITLGLEAAHVNIEGGALTGDGEGMNGGDGYDWEYYRIGLSRDLVAGIDIDLSYYYNSERKFFKTYYDGKGVADTRMVFTLSKTF